MTVTAPPPHRTDPKPTVRENPVGFPVTLRDHISHIFRILDDLSARQKTVFLLATIIGAMATILTCLETVMVLDAVLYLSNTIRIALWIPAMVLTIGGGGSLAAIIAIRRVHRIRWAKQIEARHPEFNCELITFVELSEPGRDLSPVEIEVAATLGKTSRKRLTPLPLEKQIRHKPLWITLIWLGAAVLIMIVIFIVTTPRFGILLRRALQPVASIDKPTLTRITRITVNGVPVQASTPILIPRGKPCEFRVAVTGRYPDRAIVKTIDPQDNTDDFPMAPLSGATDSRYGNWFSVTRPGIYNTIRFNIVAGDDKEGPFTVIVKSAPLVNDVLITVSPPAYARGDVNQFRNSDAYGYPGSKVDIQAVTNRPPARDPIMKSVQAAVVLTDSRGATLSRPRLFVQGNVIDASFTLRRAVRVEVRFTDRYGFENSEKTSYRITIVEDKPPEIGILHASHNKTIPLDAVFNASIEAYDDLGLWTIGWRVGVMDEPGGDITPIFNRDLKKPRGESTRATLTASLSPSQFNAAPGQILVIVFHADDNHSPRQRTRTPPITLRITPAAFPKKSAPTASQPNKPPTQSSDNLAPDSANADQNPGGNPKAGKQPGADTQNTRAPAPDTSAGPNTGSPPPADTDQTNGAPPPDDTSNGDSQDDTGNASDRSAEGAAKPGEQLEAAGQRQAEQTSSSDTNPEQRNASPQTPGESGPSGGNPRKPNPTDADTDRQDTDAGDRNASSHDGAGDQQPNSGQGNTPNADSNTADNGRSGSGGGGGEENTDDTSNTVPEENPDAATGETGLPSPSTDTISPAALNRNDIHRSPTRGQPTDRNVKPVSDESLDIQDPNADPNAIQRALKNRRDKKSEDEDADRPNASQKTDPEKSRARRTRERKLVPRDYLDKLDDYYKRIAQ